MQEQQNIVDDRQAKVDLAEATNRIINSDDFELVFNQKFLNAFAITNVHNAFALDGDGRRRFMEKTLARSYFSEFITTIMNEGADAAQSLATGDVAKKILTLAGVHDCWAFTRGQTQTVVNYAKAVFDALKQNAETRITESEIKNISIVSGSIGPPPEKPTSETSTETKEKEA